MRILNFRNSTGRTSYRLLLVLLIILNCVDFQVSASLDKYHRVRHTKGKGTIDIKLRHKYSQKYLQLLKTKVNARTPMKESRQYLAQLQIVLGGRNGTVQIRRKNSNSMLCFDRVSRLKAKQKNIGDRCTFIIEEVEGRYFKLRSAIRDNWYVGFDKQGDALKGYEYTLIDRKGMDPFLFTIDSTFRTKQQQSLRRPHRLTKRLLASSSQRIDDTGASLSLR